MEQYSPYLHQALQRQLRAADDTELTQLRTYYEQRGGPGLDLVKAEQAARQPPVMRICYVADHPPASTP